MNQWSIRRVVYGTAAQPSQHLAGAATSTAAALLWFVTMTGTVYAKTNNLVHFDSLLRPSSSARSLFTCARSSYPALGPSTNAHTTHLEVGSGASSVRYHSAPSVLAEVGIGMSVAGTWMIQPQWEAGSRSSMLSARARSMLALRACEEGYLVGCASATWMARAPQLDVLLLADCQPLCADASIAAAIADATTRVNGSGRGASGREARVRRSRAHGCAHRQAMLNWTRTTPLHFNLPAWLTSEHQASVRARCYWGDSNNGAKKQWWSYRKTAVLVKELLDQLPAKRFYLKLDVDALLRPTNLAHFLGFLRTELAEGAPIYFGSAYGTYGCTSVDDVCRSYQFNKGVGPGQRDARAASRGRAVRGSGVMGVRDTEAWSALERELLQINSSLTDERQHLAGLGVKYALGGAYGFSHAALSRLVGTRCMHKVGQIECPSCKRRIGNGQAYHHEDANVGLCMHLNRIKLLQCACFHMMSHVGSIGIPRPWDFDRGPEQDALADELRRTAFNGSEGSIGGGPVPEVIERGAHVRDGGLSVGRTRGFAAADAHMLPAVRHLFNDERPESTVSMHTHRLLCKHPIVLHAVKNWRAFLAFSAALDIRDVASEGKLREWRLAHGHASSAATRLGR